MNTTLQKWRNKLRIYASPNIDLPRRLSRWHHIDTTTECFHLAVLGAKNPNLSWQPARRRRWIDTESNS